MPRTTSMIEALEHRLYDVIQLLRNAGDAIMEIYSHDFDVTIKKDNSPVTLADMRSSEIISQGLNTFFKDVPILSEENETIDYNIRRYWDYFWLLDPLDGTREFIKRNNEFCINLALIHRHQPVAGFIYQPVKKILYHAIGTGQVVRTDSSNHTQTFTTKPALNISNVAFDNSEPLVIITSRSHSNPSEQQTINAITNAGYNVSLASQGSAIKFCMMAENKVHMYLRYGPTSEWDTAAGHALLQAIGGLVVDTKNHKPLVYNKEQLLNPSFAALSPSVKQLVDYIL